MTKKLCAHLKVSFFKILHWETLLTKTLAESARHSKNNTWQILTAFHITVSEKETALNNCWQNSGITIVNFERVNASGYRSYCNYYVCPLKKKQLLLLTVI